MDNGMKCTCEFIDIGDGQNLKVSICKTCEKQPLRIIVESSLAVMRLTNDYKKLAEQAKKYRQEVEKIRSSGGQPIMFNQHMEPYSTPSINEIKYSKDLLKEMEENRKGRELELKVALIKDIEEQHPTIGVSRGWSTYTGGMKDSGYWNTKKMLLDVPYEEIEEFHKLNCKQ